MERIISWWVRNPVAANLLMLGIVLAGVLGFITVEREAFPKIETQQVQIQVVWPGAVPQEVEEQIVLRIEEALSDLDNVKRINSIAAENLAQVNIQTLSLIHI